MGLGYYSDWADESLSARRAWIEILQKRRISLFWFVALRKESVDRNKLISNVRPPLGRSLSARRAWIEMAADCASGNPARSRSPQGERG